MKKTNYVWDPDITEPLISLGIPLDAEFELVLQSKKPMGQITRVTLRQFVEPPRMLIVNFWATWCPPCIEELPSLEFLHRQLELTRSIHLPRVIAISVDESAEAVKDLYRTLNFRPSITILLNKGGSLARQLGTVKFPETYLIDQTGRVVHKWVGPQNWLSSEVIREIAHVTDLR